MTSPQSNTRQSNHPSNWADTNLRYGYVSRVLHWLMAAMIFWQFLGMTLRAILGRTPLVAFFVKWHPIVGSTLLVLILLRLAWFWLNRHHRPGVIPPVSAPRYGSGINWAKAGHVALYGLMLCIPLLGFIRLYGSGRGFAPFGIEVFAETGQEIAWTIALADALHGELAWFFLVLIVGHIAMVYIHEKYQNDGTLKRMAGRLKKTRK
ncbi:cytochrome b [Pseudohongiella nitratireducens]|uniref:cytochrome b n=1 Tax=Pseudohongiella nitratireducens TaxID=1768907 RepID=UPI0030EEEBBF|tara:strand:- start:2892 stop:3512 length:621 start_codon:yes stop_codon:yes gene_type:complete